MSSDEAGKQGTLESSLDSGVGCIQFAHPKGNSLPGALLKQLATQIDEFGNDQSVKVVVIQSAGERAFCAGASFDEFLAVSNLEESKDFFGGFARVILAIRPRCPTQNRFADVRCDGN